MPSLYIDRRNLTLTIDHDALVFREEDRRINTVPLNVIDRICIKGDTALSANVLAKLGEKGIGLMILGSNSRHPVLLLPNPKTDSRRRIAQYQTAQNPHLSLTISKNLIAEKIQNQIHTLQHIDTCYPHNAARRTSALDSLARLHHGASKADSIASLRGTEGAAAAQYFQAWTSFLPPSLNFSGRNRRPPKDPINAVLSLGYTLLHFDIARQLHLIGLDPYIGFYHQIQHGRESLAGDLIEPLRPQYDRWALALFREQTLRPQDFGSHPKNGCQMHKAARLTFYRAYEQQAKQWRQDIRQFTTRLLKYLAAVSRQPDIAQDTEWTDIGNPTEETRP